MRNCRKNHIGNVLCFAVILIAMLFNISFAAPQDPNLVGWWKFDESGGNIAYDSSGYGNHCTLQVNEAHVDDANYVKFNSFVPGVSGNALELDGTWHTAYIPHDDILGPSKEVTFSIWLKTNTLEKECWIFNKGDITRRYFGIEENGSDYKFNFDIHTKEISTKLTSPVTAAEFADNQWHLYTCVYDGNDAIIYRDGVVLNQLNCPGEISSMGNGTIYLGSCSNYCPSGDPGLVHYDGLMDDFRIYNRALTQAEILEMLGSLDGPTDPSPAFGEKAVSVDTVLSWKPNSEAASFDVYMGTDPQAVEDANTSSDEFMGNQALDTNSFDPNGLLTGTIYYWRVDEVNEADVTKGQVWNFETLGDVDPNLIGWWKFDEESGNTAYDSSGNNNHAAIAGNPLRQAGAIDNAAVFFGTDEYAQVGNESHFDLTSNLSISAWVKISEFDTSAMYIVSKSQSYFIFKDMDCDTLTFICEGTGMPVMGSVNVVDGKWHHVVGVHDSSYNYLYVDGQLDMKQKVYCPLTINDNSLNIGNDAVWPDKEFNGSIDDARVYNKALSASEVMDLAAVRFAVAHDPQPTDKSVYVPVNKTLSWQAGNYAVSHDIYLGADYESVTNADTSSDEYMGNQTENNISPVLELNTTYYWRVDEVNDANICPGNVWSFTTTDEMPDPNLIGCWKLDTGYGYTVYDVSGNGNHGAISHNSLWTSSKGYMGLRVSSDSYGGAEIEDEQPFDITNEITIATWLWHSGWARWNSNDVVIGKGSTAYKIYRNGGWLGEDPVKFQLEGVGSLTATDKSFTANEEWHHVAATYDGSAMNIYIDGQLDSTVAASGQIETNNEKLWLGNDPISKKNFATGGVLRDARIYNRALSAAEIDALATPLCATRPLPADDVDSVADVNVTLSWRPGKSTDSHDLYLSSEYAYVHYSKAGGDGYIANLTPDCNSYDIAGLERGKYYYWRVDEIDGLTVYKGDVWSFYVPLLEGDIFIEDIDGDGTVNLTDFAVIADSWTQKEPDEPNDPNDPNDPNAVAMDVSFQCTSQATDTDIRLSLAGISVGLDVDDDGYAVFETCGEVQWLSTSGEPAIPYKVTTVLLPADVDMASVSAEFAEVVYKKVADSWKVKPVGPMVTWIDGRDVEKWPEGKIIVDGKDVAIYENNSLWPAKEIIFTGKGQLRKYNVATIAVPLVRCNPVTGELVRLAMADIAVTYSTGAKVQSALMSKADPTGQRRIKSLAINFDQMAESYGESEMLTADCGGGPLPGYIIMTTNYIVENSTELDNFIAHKQARGFDVDVVTEDQWGGDTGDDAAENMRSWLVDNWADDGLADYLLLIGSPDPSSDLPMKNLSGNSYGMSVSDFYYASLTGSWDIDGDEVYGESSSDVSDVYYELMVGRIPFYGVFKDLDHILAKTIDYECQFAVDTQWRKNTLSAMKPLNDSYGTSWAFGEDMAIEIFDPAGWPYFKLYDMTHLPDGLIPDATPCSYYTFTDIWSKGEFGSVIYSTHGGGDGDTTSEVIKTSLLYNMNDRYPGMIFGASCWGAKPEARRNIIYQSLINGCIGGCGSTRPSWYSPSQKDFSNSGSCEGQGYEFYERIVQGMPAGKALYELKQQQQFSWWTNNKILNLYGDPSVIVKPAEPGDLNQDGFFDMQDMAILSRRWLESR